MMQIDLLIKGGKIVEPTRDELVDGDVLIKNNIIVEPIPGEEIIPKSVLDAKGCLVMPGLIDYHTHVFPGGTHIGIHADSTMLCQGVTAVVDQGSAGPNNFESFMQVIAANQVRTFAYLHVSPAGLATLPKALELVAPQLYDKEALGRFLQKYSSHLLGLKLRQSREVVGEWGVKPLAATVKIAEEFQCPVVVHTTNPPCEVAELLALLRKGDTYTHVFQGKGPTILNAQKRVEPSVQAARTRGVVFDTADGRGHYAFAVIKAALQDGFLPDVVSTDVVRSSVFEHSVYGLPYIMTKYLNLGMSLAQVVRACTQTPAQLMGMAGKLGTLKPGAFGDVAIFKLKETNLQMEDVFGEILPCTQILVPQATILNGNIAYRSLDF